MLQTNQVVPSAWPGPDDSVSMGPRIRMVPVLGFAFLPLAGVPGSDEDIAGELVKGVEQGIPAKHACKMAGMVSRKLKKHGPLAEWFLCQG